jgi:hypothetical protein
MVKNISYISEIAAQDCLGNIIRHVSKQIMSGQKLKFLSKSFKKSSNFMKNVFDPNTIKTIAIVAYGKDYQADVTVSVTRVVLIFCKLI